MRTVSLPKGTFVRFQPHSKKFFQAHQNDKLKMVAMLEYKITKFSTLTLGETIEITDDGEKYLLNVLELQPSSAISLLSNSGFIELQIDITQPLDYNPKEEENKNQEEDKSDEEENSGK